MSDESENSARCPVKKFRTISCPSGVRLPAASKTGKTIQSVEQDENAFDRALCEGNPAKRREAVIGKRESVESPVRCLTQIVP